MLVSRGSMRHRKSASWSAMPPPTSTSASSSTRIDHSCQSAILGIESNDYADEENSDKNLTDMSASSSTSVCSSATDNVQGIDKHWKPKRSVEESATACSGLSSLLKHKASPFPLPSIFCISHSALSSENAESTDIVPFVYPETIPIERISMLASTLESLLRIVDQELLLVDTEPCTADAMQPPPCCVVGLGAFKVAISDRDIVDDVALVKTGKSFSHMFYVI